jgi:thymidylate kinase
MNQIPKLIIIRGPSGAGKSSVAKALKEQAKRPTLLVSEDKIRQMFNDHHLPKRLASKELTTRGVLLGLEYSYDVILEGILNIKTNKERIARFFTVHPEENYFFYLDVSYEETLLRHQTRPEKDEFGEEAMKEWWDYASPVNHFSETIIPETSSLEATVKLIQKTTGI